MTDIEAQRRSIEETRAMMLNSGKYLHSLVELWYREALAKLPSEAEHEKVSTEVRTVVEHLRNNRTTETEARTLRDAADKSIRDHGTAKSIGRLP